MLAVCDDDSEGVGAGAGLIIDVFTYDGGMGVRKGQPVMAEARSAQGWREPTTR